MLGKNNTEECTTNLRQNDFYTKSFASPTPLCFLFPFLSATTKLCTRESLSNLLHTMQGSFIAAVLQNVEKLQFCLPIIQHNIPLLLQMYIRSEMPSVQSQFILSTVHLFCCTFKREHVEQMREAGYGDSISAV